MAAITILGTVLAGMVLANSRHKGQRALAQRKLIAAAAADELISEWWMDPEGIPLGRSGTLAEDQSLTWQTRVVSNEAIEALGARVARIEVCDAKAAQSAPLIAVEVVLPAEKRESP